MVLSLRYVELIYDELRYNSLRYILNCFWQSSSSFLKNRRPSPQSLDGRRQLPGDEIDKSADAVRQLVPLRIDGVDIGIRRLVIRQHLDQAAVLQIGLQIPLRAHQDAVAVERPVDGDFAVVGRQSAAYLDRLGLGAGRHAPDAIGLVALPDADAIVPGQVVRRDRRAAPRQIRRRGAKQAPVGG